MDFVQTSITGEENVVTFKPRPVLPRYRVVAFGKDGLALGSTDIIARSYSQARRQGAKKLRWDTGITGTRYACYASGTRKYLEYEVMREAA